jgi:hypothetical protein
VSTLRELLSALDTAVEGLVEAPAGDDAEIASVALVDNADLAVDIAGHSAMADLYLHVGVPESDAVAWLDAVAQRPAQQRPAVVMSKTVSTVLRTHPARRESREGGGMAEQSQRGPVRHGHHLRW